MIRSLNANTELYNFPVAKVGCQLDAAIPSARYYTGDTGALLIRPDKMKIIGHVSSDYILYPHNQILTIFETLLAGNGSFGEYVLKDIILFGPEHSSICCRYNVIDQSMFIQIKRSFNQPIQISWGIYNDGFSVISIIKTWNVPEELLLAKHIIPIIKYIRTNLDSVVQTFNSLEGKTFPLTSTKLPLPKHLLNPFTKRFAVGDNSVRYLLKSLAYYIEERCITNPEEAFECQEKLYPFIIKLIK